MGKNSSDDLVINMYYVAYNRRNNRLVDLQEQTIEEDELVAVAVFEGDLPDLSRYAWNSAILDWYKKARRRITKLEYINLLTDEELAGIYAAAKAHPAVEVWLAKFNATTPEEDGTAIDLDDPRTIDGVNMLEVAGLIGPGRAAEILSN